MREKDTGAATIPDGKKPIVALVTLMRKIIVIQNARLRDDLATQS